MSHDVFNGGSNRRRSGDKQVGVNSRGPHVFFCHRSYGAAKLCDHRLRTSAPIAGVAVEPALQTYVTVLVQVDAGAE